MSYQPLPNDMNGIDDIDKEDVLAVFCALQLYFKKSAEFDSDREEYKTAIELSFEKLFYSSEFYPTNTYLLSGGELLCMEYGTYRYSGAKWGIIDQLYFILRAYDIVGNELILTDVARLETNHPIKRALEELCGYHNFSRESYRGMPAFKYKEYKSFFHPHYSNAEQDTAKYYYFCENFTGDITNKIIFSAEKYFLETEQNKNNQTAERKKTHPNKRYFYFDDFMSMKFYFDCKFEEVKEWNYDTMQYEIVDYNIISAKITEKSKEDLKTELKRFGFPYSNSYLDYVKFLTNFLNSKHIFLDKMFKEDVKNLRDKKVRAKLDVLFRLFFPSQIKPQQFINHTHIIGRSGSGKSEFLKTIIKQVGKSCILLDPHGDIANSLDKKQGFFKVAPAESRFVINPFHITDKSIDNRELVAEEIIQLLQEIIQDSNVSVLMKTISFPIISTLLKLPYADFRMFADCINPISGLAFLERLSPLVDDHHKRLWEDLKTDAYDTTKRSIFNRLQSFLNKHKIISTVCGYDDFSEIIKRVEQGENLVISLPIPQLGEDVSEVLGRFFMCRMQIWAKRRQTLAEKDRKAVVLIVDECQNFLSEETARTLDQFGRKFGLYMVLAHQHIDQIDGKGLKGSMLANCKNKIVGYCDEKTAKTMSSAMGVPSDEFKELKKGHWWGLFEDKEPLKFYARLAKFKTTGESVAYAPSQNTDFLDGWEIVQDSVQNAVQNTQKTPKFTAKFDL